MKGAMERENGILNVCRAFPSIVMQLLSFELASLGWLFIYYFVYLVGGLAFIM